jgi:hypothetical protein
MNILTKEDALKLTYGNLVSMNNEKNYDGTCCRWRVTGKIKTWKTRPEEFKVPLKHGMYDYGYLTEKNFFYFHVHGSCDKCGM